MIHNEKNLSYFLLFRRDVLYFNTVAYAQAENTAQEKIGGADKATDIQVNNNVNTVKRWILINIPARSLRLYDNDKCIEMYPVGVGKIETKTPVGFYKVVEKNCKSYMDRPC